MGNAVAVIPYQNGPYDFLMSAGDTLPYLQAQLFNSDGTVVNLTGLNVSFSLRDSRSLQLLQLTGVVSIISALDGMVQMAFSQQDTSAYGAYQGQFTVTNPSTGDVETFPNSPSNIAPGNLSSSSNWLQIEFSHTLGLGTAPYFIPQYGPRGVQGVPGAGFAGETPITLGAGPTVLTPTQQQLGVMTFTGTPGTVVVTGAAAASAATSRLVTNNTAGTLTFQSSLGGTTATLLTGKSNILVTGTAGCRLGIIP